MSAARAWLPVAGLLAAGCVTPHRAPDLAGSGPALRPEAFFAGETRGRGTLQVAGRGTRSFDVVSFGRREGEAIRVDQTIRYSDGKVEQRFWVLRPIGPGIYEGTLSDAAGPVRARVSGNALHLRYLVRRPAVVMEQWLTPQPDGRALRNEGTVRAFGIPVARLSERIVRADPAPR